MNLLFIQGGSRWKYDSEGTLYTDPNFNSQIWSRYKGYCDELTVVLRREDRIYTKEEARIKFNEIGNSIDHCVALPDMYRPLSNALSCQKRMLVKRTIESEVKKADKVIIRSLGNIYTNTALKYAQKYHKPYLVEVTGFAWESLWYHSLHGKFVAGFKEKQYKRLIKNVKYGVYVTNEALQKRYPSSLNKFGFNLTGRAYHEFRAASGITIGNAYSALRNYYHDYSIFGVILFNYILTFVFSIKYYDLKYCSDITYKKAFSLTLYASFIYTVFFQFFTDYFFARLSVGLFIEVIVLRICFWFVMRLKVCFGRR